MPLSVPPAGLSAKERLTRTLPRLIALPAESRSWTTTAGARAAFSSVVRGGWTPAPPPAFVKLSLRASFGVMLNRLLS